MALTSKRYLMYSQGDNNMKLIQKGLLFVSLFTIGTGSISIPAITSFQIVQASKIKSTKITVKVAKAQLYNEKGKKISKCLTKGTTKKTSEKKSIKNCTYYQIGKDQYVKSSNVSLK